MCLLLGKLDDYDQGDDSARAMRGRLFVLTK
jgi:hypothetical protein